MGINSIFYEGTLVQLVQSLANKQSFGPTGPFKGPYRPMGLANWVFWCPIGPLNQKLDCLSFTAHNLPSHKPYEIPSDQASLTIHYMSTSSHSPVTQAQANSLKVIQ